MILRLNGGPTLGPRRVVPYLPVKLPPGPGGG